jgi:tetratricopeptide (TPR) repeat protein
MKPLSVDRLADARCVTPAEIENRGYSLLRSGFFDQAHTIFETLVALAPNGRCGHAGLAWTAESQWRWGNAIEQWDECIGLATDATDAEAIARKSHCLVQVGRIERARDLLESISDRFEALQGLANIATLQETPLIAGLRWDECMLQFPDRIAGFLGKASLLLQQEAYDEADALLSHVVAVWPESVVGRAWWARCSTLAKDWNLARIRWKFVLDRHSDEREVRNGYARYLGAIADRSTANAYASSLHNNPVAEAEFALEFQLAQDDFGAIVTYATKLAGLEPQSPWRQFDLATAFMRYGSSQARALALGSLKDLLSRSPDSVAIKAQLIDSYIRSGYEQEAIDLLQTVPLEDKRYEIETLRAWSLQRRGEERAARKNWNAILARQYFPAIHARIQNLSRIDDNDIQLRKDEILLFSAVRNERPRLDWFMRYYRKLGVDKFIIVDNGSTDGSAELLLNHCDVILYKTSDQYSRSGWGMRWINELIERYGKKNWCIFVDADEAFIYPEYENLNLHGLADYLGGNGYEAMPATMLDMYPAVLPSGDTQEDFERRKESYVFFDNQFHRYGFPICPYQEVHGGIRRRLFHGYQIMNKVPLINGAADVKFLVSSHLVTPCKLADIGGALLHYHLIYLLEPTLRSLARDEIERREHSSNASERLRILEALPPAASTGALLGPDSVQFQSNTQLVDLGVMRASEGLLRHAESRPRPKYVRKVRRAAKAVRS